MKSFVGLVLILGGLTSKCLAVGDEVEVQRGELELLKDKLYYAINNFRMLGDRPELTIGAFVYEFRMTPHPTERVQASGTTLVEFGNDFVRLGQRLTSLQGQTLTSKVDGVSPGQYFEDFGGLVLHMAKNSKGASLARITPSTANQFTSIIANHQTALKTFLKKYVLPQQLPEFPKSVSENRVSSEFRPDLALGLIAVLSDALTKSPAKPEPYLRMLENLALYVVNGYELEFRLAEALDHVQAEPAYRSQKMHPAKLDYLLSNLWTAAGSEQLFKNSGLRSSDYDLYRLVHMLRSENMLAKFPTVFQSYQGTTISSGAKIVTGSIRCRQL